MKNQKLIDLINNMLIHSNYDDDRYDFNDEKIAGLAQQILSQMHDAWAVFYPNGNIEHKFTSQYEWLAWNSLVFSDEKYHDPKYDIDNKILEYKDKGYTVKKIKWLVADED